MLHINCQRQSVIITQNDLSFPSVFCSQKHTALGLSDIPSEIHTQLPISQSALKQSQSYTKKTNGQNYDDKAKKPALSSHSLSVNYCNILTHFLVTNNKVKVALIVVSESIKLIYS